jgi:hypothetical protein
VRVGRLISLLAVKEPRLIALEGDIEGMDVGDVIGVEVAEVGVELGTGDLGAGLLEARLGEGVVDGAEVEVDALALADAVDVGWVEDQLLVRAHEHGDDGRGRAVDGAGGDFDGATGFVRDGIGGGEGEEAEDGGEGGEGFHGGGSGYQGIGILGRWLLEWENECAFNSVRRCCFACRCVDMKK